MEKIIKLIESNQLEAAEEAINQLLIIEPSNYKLKYLLATIYFKRNEYDKALNSFSILANIDPNDFRTFFNMGAINEKKGNFELAILMYNKVIELKKDHEQALKKINTLNLRVRENGNKNESSPNNIEIDDGKGHLIYEWSPKRTASILYYLYALLAIIPTIMVIYGFLDLRLFLKINNDSFSADFFKVAVGLLGIPFTIYFLPKSIKYLISAIFISHYHYKIYENLIEFKSPKGSNFATESIEMHNIDNLELRSDFPLNLTNDATISFVYGVTKMNQEKNEYSLFTFNDYEKMFEVFEYLKKQIRSSKKSRSIQNRN